MRIHTDHLNSSDFYSAALIARVYVEDLTRHGSRSRKQAFNVLLTGESKRRPNLGTSRNRDYEGRFAATWDQWGVFLAVLFQADGKALRAAGANTDRAMFTPYDESAEHFAARTGDRFGAPEDVIAEGGYTRVFVSHGWPEDAHGDHVFRHAGTPYEQTCTKCSAVQRWGQRLDQYLGA